MVKTPLIEAYSHCWSSSFQHLPDPVALWQKQPRSTVRLLQCNDSFRQLFQLSKTGRSNPVKQLPEDFVQLVCTILKAPDPEAMLWNFQTSTGPKQFRLQLSHQDEANPGCFLLLMHDTTGLLTQIEHLQKQNDDLQQRLADIERLKNRISEQAIRDPLTNLFNRRFLNEFMERELALARRNQKPLAVVMLDLDHFKQLNDQFGHQTGDLVIEMVAKHLLRQSRRTDILFRYGGEEFLVILPNTTAAQAKHLAENWRVHVSQAQVFAKHQPVSITLSAGIAVYPEHGTTAFNLIQTADEALYQAKAAGRNQVMMS